MNLLVRADGLCVIIPLSPAQAGFASHSRGLMIFGPLQKGYFTAEAQCSQRQVP